MRGTKVQGRFKIDFENRSMEEGMVDELRDPVGSEVDWWTWDPNALAADYNNFVDPTTTSPTRKMARVAAGMIHSNCL